MNEEKENMKRERLDNLLRLTAESVENDVFPLSGRHRSDGRRGDASLQVAIGVVMI